MQLSLPAWVRARGLSVYQLVFMGGQAIGSLLGAAGRCDQQRHRTTGQRGTVGVLRALSAWWWPLHARTAIWI